jgi:hypothetical protein
LQRNAASEKVLGFEVIREVNGGQEDAGSLVRKGGIRPLGVNYGEVNVSAVTDIVDSEGLGNEKGFLRIGNVV